ncbi:MAG: N-formylglutamate amidohydrolase [Clostridia bacterium]|nr:N-formylglutamate amidohydrolase [Clostridia bacterium]
MIKTDSPLLLHIPHSSTVIPKEELPSFCADDLPGELLRMTDHYCDEIFTGYDRVVFPVSRLVCDPERFRDDASEPMSKVGMGAVYTSTSSGSPLRSVTPSLRESILSRYYDPHHRLFTEAVSKKLDSFGRCLIVDGHSFSPVPLPYESDRRSARPDICIGTDAFHTPGLLADAAAEHFRSAGFSVAMNFPYCGSIVPMRYYGIDRRVSSVMIEINRGLYMCRGGERNAGFPVIKRTVSELLELLDRMMRETGEAV